MPGDQQRHQLVAQLGVREPRAVLVPRLQEQREDVATIAEVGGRPSPRDLAVQLGVHRRRLAPEAIEPHQPVGSQEAEHERAARVGRPAREAPQQPTEPFEPWPVLHAEHRPQYHAQRDRVHPRQRRLRTVQRPGRHLAPGRVADHVLVLAHALAVERREHELAPPQVLGAVEQQHVAGAQERAQRHVRHPGVDLVGPVRVQLLDGVGVGQDHPRLPYRPHGEHVAVRPVRGLEERVWRQAIVERLQRNRRTGTGREPAHAVDSHIPIWGPTTVSAGYSCSAHSGGSTPSRFACMRAK